MNIDRYRKIYANWQAAATLEQLYRYDRDLAAFELMLILPYRRYKKLMHIDGGPWF